MKLSCSVKGTGQCEKLKQLPCLKHAVDVWNCSLLFVEHKCQQDAMGHHQGFYIQNITS